MTWDLRSKYAFDASEGQIPEGNVSVYGPANSHANCVPASFTAALDLAGYGDIDPQRITNEVYGPNYRGGFGNFTKCIAWIRNNVPKAPAFSDTGFDFAAADAAGQAGQLIIVAGWINAASVTFTAQSNANGFSHASLLAGNLGNGKYLIWNTWTGAFQTYDRAVLAASLYEMSIMAPSTFSGGGGSLPGVPLATEAEIEQAIRSTGVAGGITSLYNVLVGPADRLAAGAHPTEGLWEKLDAVQIAVGKIPAGTGGGTDPALVTAITDLTAAVQALSKHLGLGTP